MFLKTFETGMRSAGQAIPRFSVLGPDLLITGDITASADLHIDGCVQGDVRCGSLFQGESSRIRGTIVADSAHLAGTVEGSVNATTLTISPTAHVIGDVTYETIHIEVGGTVEGCCSVRAAALRLSESVEEDEG